MKSIRTITALVVVLAVFAAAATALAEDGHKGHKGHHGGRMKHMAKALELTEDQQAQVKAIMDQAKADAEAAETKEAKMEIFKAAHEKVQAEVLTEEQKAKQAELREKMGEHHSKMRGRRHGRMAEALGMTEEQKTQAKAIMDQAKTDAEGVETNEEKKPIFKAAHEKIQAEVLTDEQQAKVDEWKAKREALKLTDEQKAQAKAIMDQAKTDAEGVETKEEKRAIFKAAHEKIRSDVLTEAQAEAFKGRGRMGRRCGKGSGFRGGGCKKSDAKADEGDGLEVEPTE